MGNDNIVINNEHSHKSVDIIVDEFLKQAFLSDRTLELTTKEFDILNLLINNPGDIFSRNMLLEKVWGYDYYGDSRTVDIHIRRLRKKIEPDPANPKFILTKWGKGYFYKNGAI